MSAVVKKLLTVNETAAAMGVCRKTVYNLMDAGQLAWVQVGAHRRVAATEIDRFIDEHTQVAS